MVQVAVNWDDGWVTSPANANAAPRVGQAAPASAPAAAPVGQAAIAE